MASKTRPKKPYPSYPLYAHATGRWAKTIRGKTRYFGPWRDPDGALALFLDQQADLYAGRVPRKIIDAQANTVSKLCNRFLADKKALVDNGELSQRHWDDCLATAKTLTATLGRDRRLDDIHPNDFAELRQTMAQGRALSTLSTEISRARAIFAYAGPDHLGWLRDPMRYGPMFSKPSKKSLRIEAAKKGDTDLPREVIEAVLTCDRIKPAMKAMVLLGVGNGLGNNDCALLSKSHLDLEGGWLHFPRPKTGFNRRSKLWPETIEAIDSAMNPSSGSERVFVTKYGNSWEGSTSSDPISAEFRKLLRATGTYEKGRSFYSLRRTFQTQADECQDFPAITLAMGHSDDSMAARYRQRISPRRLELVADTVRNWLSIEAFWRKQ